jgi:hypothetical protein
MPRVSTLRLTYRLAFAPVVLLAVPLGAQNAANSAQQQGGPLREILAKETYVTPPPAIERLVTAPRQNNVSLSNQSPDRKHFLKLQSEGPPERGAPPARGVR